MNGIQLGENMSRRFRKLTGIELTKLLGRRKISEQLLQLGDDVLWIAEHVAALRRSHAAQFARPVVDILIEVPMKRAVMPLIEIAGRQGLFGPLRRDRVLEFRKFVLRPKAKPVFQD